ncbi:pirin family protein [Citricoccus sp. NR2]|uniref:pirin family protein n=1 Tax=Citricoccus sp. NR2 TaxID=3004095 RepID=UPI0022DD72FA|nr:pirin family protein [Citricoccus sp. NR2]WBL19193.1 pirin family protein [Citricoccus sp. NR2]
MTNLEKNPEETICENGPRFTEGLTPGVRRESAGDAPGNSVVEVLEPRDVPLGGPRAMTVRRTLPQRARSLVGAWCFLDFFGPDDVAESGGMQVARHPHTGLATVSWLFEGRVDHIDSAGNWATVRPGEVNLMNAGRGITHSEHSTDDTTVLHGVQLWYAFPDAHRFTDPSLAHHRPTPIRGDGFEAKVFLGSLLGYTSPVPTYLPLTGAEIRLEPGAELVVEVPAEHEHGVLAVSGALQLNGVTVEKDHLGVVDNGVTRLTITAGDDPTLAVLIGGEPLGEQIVMWWNFIGRSHEEILTFRAAYQQEMGFETPAEGSPIPADHPRGAAIAGPDLDALIGMQYDDGRSFPQFGEFPPGRPAPLPAPEPPNTRMRPRG